MMTNLHIYIPTDRQSQSLNPALCMQLGVMYLTNPVAGDQVIHFLTEKKQEEEETKAQRKTEREAKRAEHE